MNIINTELLAKKLARDLLAFEDGLNSKAHRIAFKRGKYPDKEIESGGMCETTLVKFFDEQIKKYLHE